MIYDLGNIQDFNELLAKVNYFVEHSKVVELTEKRKPRTLNQNSYLHVCITLAAIELGYTIEEMKFYFKVEFNKISKELSYEKNGHKFIKSTSDFDTKLMTRFIDYIRTTMGKQGIYIPTAEEYLTNKYQIDKQIKINEQYL